MYLGSLLSFDDDIYDKDKKMMMMMINDDYVNDEDDDGDDDHDGQADLGKPSAPIVLWGQSISALSSTSSNFLNLEPVTTLMKCIEMYCTLMCSDLTCFGHNLPISTTLKHVVQGNKKVSMFYKVPMFSFLSDAFTQVSKI